MPGNQGTRGSFIISFMLTVMLTQCMGSYASSIVFSTAIWLRLSCISALSWSAAGTIILLPFIAVHSMSAISSVNYQYGCNSFCSSNFVDGQQWSMSSDNMPRCLSYIVAILISSALMQLGMLMHESIVLMVIHMSSISSYLFVSCLSVLWF